MNTPVYVLLVLVLAHALICLRARRLTRLAQARLWLSESVLEMERLMCSGLIANGEATHDYLFKKMATCQLSEKLGVKWNFFIVPTAEERAQRAQLLKELTNRTEATEALTKFVRSSFSVFRNSRPVAAFCFSLWAICCGEAILMVIAALRTALRVHEFCAKVRQCSNGNGFVGVFHNAVAAWFVVKASDD